MSFRDELKSHLISAAIHLSLFIFVPLSALTSKHTPPPISHSLSMTYYSASIRQHGCNMANTRHYLCHSIHPMRVLW